MIIKKIFTAMMLFFFCLSNTNTIEGTDENYYAVREKKGNPAGLIFKDRLNNKVFTLIMTGLYSSDHSLIRDLVIPKLQNIDDFQIKE
jgi:rRNA maturation protein Rpf1